MKISIIIPIYNVAEYIERCILSVFNQTYQSIEIIIVDDCGSDNSMDIARKICIEKGASKEIIFAKHERNRGLSAARNTGVDLATGEYIYFLDSDDAITSNCIELMVDRISEYKYDFVIGDYKVIDSNRSYPPLTIECDSIKDAKSIQTSYFNSEWYMMAWNKLVNREFFISNNLYFKEGLIHEDDLWSFQLAITANSMAIVNEKIYNYYIRENSITSKKYEDLISHRKVIISSMVEIIESLKRDVSSGMYRFVESQKTRMFANAIKHNLKQEALEELYNNIRKNRIKDNKQFSFNQKILNIHYFLPHNIGFWYYTTLVKLSVKK